MKIAGLDIGTTGCKCTVFDENGMTADTNAYFTDELGLDFSSPALFVE